MTDALWCLDSNAFINAWNKLYAPDFAPDYWDTLARLSKEGRAFVSEEVREEIIPADDDLASWVKVHIEFHPLTDDVQLAVAQVMAAHGKLIAVEGFHSRADPFVIATGLVTGSTVVTTEEYGTRTKPKIPYVCDQMGVAHATLTEFIRAEGIFLGSR